MCMYKSYLGGSYILIQYTLVPCGAMAAHWTSNPGVASSIFAGGNGTLQDGDV